jgi:hypothetical protein
MWRLARSFRLFEHFPYAVAGQTENICEMTGIEGNGAVGSSEIVKENE